MKKIIVFKNKGKDDIFDDDDNVKNIMTPKNFSAKKLGLADKQAFLYKGYPMYLDRTVIHARKEDIPHVHELFRESVEHLDEVSREKLEQYISKAKEEKVDPKKFNKRLEGIKKAAYKSTLKKYGISEAVENFKVGDKVHLGFGVKGGAGYIGILKKIDKDGTVHVQSEKEGKFGKKEWRGHVSKLTRLSESVSLLDRINILLKRK